MSVATTCILQGGFFTGTPQFQYQKETRQAANHGSGFTGIAALIGWLAVFFLVLKLGGTSEKTTLYDPLVE